MLRLSVPVVVLAAFATAAAAAQPTVYPVSADEVPPTTLSPLIVSPLAPVPQVGDGAPYFMPEEIEARRDEAVVLDRHTRWGLQDMRPVMRSKAPKKEVFMMDFGLEALCDTLHAKGRTAIRAAADADAATRAAIAARAAQARGEGKPGEVVLTELARQSAVNAYVAARWDAQEAQARVSDFNNLMQNRLGLYALDAKLFIDERTHQRAEGGGAVGADEFADLSVVGVQAQGKPGEPLTVTGAIHNPRATPVAVPPLVVTVLDRAGLKLTDWEIAADRKATIPAGGDLAVRYELKAAPEHATGVLVNFAPSRSRPSDFSESCEISYSYWDQ